MEILPEQAVEMVKEGLAPLGEQYIKDLSRGLSEGWIDWFENKGKPAVPIRQVFIGCTHMCC